MTRWSDWSPTALAAKAATLLLLAGLSMTSVACDADPQPRGPDARLKAHVVEPSTPSPEGLAYLRGVAAAHRTADTASDGGAAALRQALALPVPADLPEAEILRLEAATRLAEVVLETQGPDLHGATVARDLLAPMLETGRSLPLDPTTARALVVLGDAAAKTGDDALAAGSYARSIRMMSMLRQELEQ